MGHLQLLGQPVLLGREMRGVRAQAGQLLIMVLEVEGAQEQQEQRELGLLEVLVALVAHRPYLERPPTMLGAAQEGKFFLVAPLFLVVLVGAVAIQQPLQMEVLALLILEVAVQEHILLTTALSTLVVLEVQVLSSSAMQVASGVLVAQ
jgi:hypothetical protein